MQDKNSALKKETRDTILPRVFGQAKKARRSMGLLFIEAAVLFPVAVTTVVGLAWLADAYVIKVRLGDSARIIARAIQDDPGISQGEFNGTLGDLDRVVLSATGNRDPIPANFNVGSYKSCNADLANYSDEAAREHFARAGRYELRPGVFGDCNQRPRSLYLRDLEVPSNKAELLGGTVWRFCMKMVGDRDWKRNCAGVEIVILRGF
jgi:hypothetical protein